ncbi:hypothetical protein [uncultured Polaribacter sp.]|uniref:hypothetical protein n=1 Tax=uncultured Polaribacter sp. TaxID=174711 RepID=UPI0026309C7C|nr:hypothetical protein [uncultured Polaribacter sp.]
MENVFKYYEFSDFFIDKSEAFSGNEISYTELNETHFLIFEKENSTYNLYVSRFKHKKEIGVNSPEIVELLVKNYNKSIPAHRLMIKQYLH